jgi:hypothetical protein
MIVDKGDPGNQDEGAQQPRQLGRQRFCEREGRNGSEESAEHGDPATAWDRLRVQRSPVRVIKDVQPR